MTGRKESPAEKQRRVQGAFEAKVAILEAWARDGVPEGSQVPRTHAALRRWAGPDGDLAQWADPMVDRPNTGKYPELTGRYKAAMENIDLRQRKSKASRVGVLEADAAVLRKETAALRLQNASLVAVVAEAEERVVLLEDLLRSTGMTIPSRAPALRRTSGRKMEASGGGNT